MSPSPELIKRRYRGLLYRSLGSGRPPTRSAAQRLGRQAMAAGLSMMELATQHELALVQDLLPATAAAKRRSVIRAAGEFFATVVTSAGHHQRGPSGNMPRIKAVLGSLSRRAIELASLNASLQEEIERRKAVEASLARSEMAQRVMLQLSERHQGQLRRLSRRLLTAQEEERRKISRELHDVIGQTLAGINLKLTTLKQRSLLVDRGLGRHLEATRKLVLKSVRFVHDFARQLRPAVLDDLGLVPALKAHFADISHRSHLRIRLRVSPEVERLDPAQCTILYRVAQEAVTNAARHAQASTVCVSIMKRGGDILMHIHDDGHSFQVEQGFAGKSGQRLGLIGMRERVEMIGGHFSIASLPGTGTTITATIPVSSRMTRKQSGLRGSRKEST